MEDQADSEDEARIKGDSGPGQSQEVWMSVWIWDYCRSKSGFKDVDTDSAGAALWRGTVNICGLCLGAKHNGGNARGKARRQRFAEWQKMRCRSRSP
jgi:hypothetical protein